MKRVYLLVLILILFLTGCNKSYYMSDEEIRLIYDKYSKRGTDNDNTIKKPYDDNQSSYLLGCSTFNGQNIYFDNGTMTVKVDKDAMIYSPLCMTAGCDHLSTLCESKLQKISMRCHGDGIYFLDGSSICYRDSEGSIKKIYTNTFKTEYTRKYDETRPSMLYGMMFIDEQTILVRGLHYFFKYNISTGEKTEPVVLPDGEILSSCYMDGAIYSTYNNMRLIKTSLNTGKSQVVSEQGIHPRVIGDRIWYAKWNDDEVCSLYSNNPEFTDEHLEISDGYVMFEVFGDVLVYEDNAHKSFYLRYGDGTIEKVFDYADLTYPYNKLPPKYQYDEQKRSPEAEAVIPLTYHDGEFYFAVPYHVVDKRGFEYEWNHVYKFNKNGELEELLMGY